MTTSNQQQGATRRGFTLLIAVLVTGIVLSIGLAILNITLKEFTLSGVVRESQIAFSAADAGIECAFYWDYSSNGGAFNSGTGPNTIQCGDSTADVGAGAPGETDTFEVRWSSPEICAEVSVTKFDSTVDEGALGLSTPCPPGVICTLVVSRGYNNCDLTNPRTVERALRARY